MNRITKNKAFLIIIVLVSLFCIYGKKNGSFKLKNAKKCNIENQQYSKELASFFSINLEEVLRYKGTYNYVEEINLNDVTGTKDKLIINLKGKVLDKSSKNEGLSNDKLFFNKTYTINKDSVLEVQSKDFTKNRHRSIEKSTILKLPLQKDNKWEDEVEFDGKKYKAQTIIKDIYNKDNKKIICTETTIKNIKFYPDNTYKEIKFYEEGIGLIRFSNNLLLDNNSCVDFFYELVSKNSSD